MNIEEVKEFVSPEDWNRTSVTSFTVEELTRIVHIASELENAEDKAEYHAFCRQKLDALKGSVVAKVLSTVTGKHPADDRYLLEVLESASENKMDDVTEYLGKLVLNFSENDFALRILGNLYEAQGRDEEKISMWERLVRVDLDEVGVLQKLAAHYEESGDIQVAMNYYQRAIRRLMKTDDFSQLKALWAKLCDLKKDNPQYLISQAERIAQNMENGRGVYFLNNLVSAKTADDKKLLSEDQTIEVLKMIIHYSDTGLHENVKNLIEMYRRKYADNPRLEGLIRQTGLLNISQDTIEASIEKFETEIQFVAGAFVFHRSWNIGRIQQIDQDNVDIVFVQKGPHRMSCEMAYSSLRVLPKYHFWVLKAVISPEKLKNKLNNDTVWALKTLIDSNGGAASFKEMKNELVPSVFTQDEWSLWYAAAKKELMSNANFGFKDGNVDSYVYRDTPVTFEEKKLNQFRAEKAFFAKVRIVRDYLANKGDIEDESFARMIQFFEQRARIVNSNIENICSWLFLNDLKNRSGINFIHISGEFLEFYELIRLNVKDVFVEIDDVELKRLFIDQLIEADPKNWPNILRDLFPYFLNNRILDALKEIRQRRVYLSILRSSVESYLQSPEVLLFLLKTLAPEEWDRAGITREKLVITQIQLLNFALLRIQNKTDVPRFRKIQQTLVQNLFESDGINSYLNHADSASAAKIYSLVSGGEYLDPALKSKVRSHILTTFADSQEILGEQSAPETVEVQAVPTSLLCTQASLDAKLAELKHLIEVEIPENAREIGIARDLGDLRENAEYQYARDKQKDLTFKKGLLSKEINEARVVLPEQVDPTKISFGTKVTLKDNLKNKTVQYTVMGQWESDPSKGILNFKAPLCARLYNHTVGETLEFNLNDIPFNLTVLKIEKEQF